MGEFVEMIRYCDKHLNSNYLESCINCKYKPCWNNEYCLQKSVENISCRWECRFDFVRDLRDVEYDKRHYPDGNWVWRCCSNCKLRELPLVPRLDRWEVAANVVALIWEVLPYEPWWQPNVESGFERVLVKKGVIGDTFSRPGFVAYDKKAVVGNPFYKF